MSFITKKFLPRRTFLRGVEYYDGPAIRKIVRDAQAADYRLSSIIVGITKSAPFTMRKSL